MFILPLLSIYAQKAASLLIRLKNGLLIFLKILGKPNTAKMKKREDVYLAASFNLCAKGGKPFDPTQKWFVDLLKDIGQA